MGRFTLLVHRVDGGAHWDLLLEKPGGELWTWQADYFPFGGAGQLARRLPDHRRVYLSYRGPVLLNRGMVRPWIRGSFALLCDSDRAFRVRLRMQATGGILSFENCQGISASTRENLWRMSWRSFSKTS